MLRFRLGCSRLRPPVRSAEVGSGVWCFRDCVPARADLSPSSVGDERDGLGFGLLFFSALFSWQPIAFASVASSVAWLLVVENVQAAPGDRNAVINLKRVWMRELQGVVNVLAAEGTRKAVPADEFSVSVTDGGAEPASPVSRHDCDQTFLI